MNTYGETRDKILAKLQRARGASVARLIAEFRQDSGMTETDLAMRNFDDGFAAGYAAGYRIGLDVMREHALEGHKALSSGIASTWR